MNVSGPVLDGLEATAPNADPPPPKNAGVLRRWVRVLSGRLTWLRARRAATDTAVAVADDAQALRGRAHADDNERTSETAATGLTRRQRKAQAWQGRHCENCRVALQGPFCHLCGQPERTPVRALVALAGDALDYMFDVDSRLFKTLKSLFFRPGRLTEAYLRGERMSFVRPLRIYLAISALLFIVVSTTSDLKDAEIETNDVRIGVGPIQPPTPPKPPGAFAAGPAGAKRIPAPPAVAAPASRDPSVPPPAPKLSPRKPISLTILDGEPWDAVKNPVDLAYLPDFADRQFNLFIATVIAKVDLARNDPKRLGHEFLRVLPQSMFVLLPIFALLLKGVMLFKRRLYMEHLMVAIHSHTFMFMGILVAIALGFAYDHWPQGWFNPWGLFTGVAIAWIPLNLFLTQKRVYRQGFFGAAFGFMIVSTLYLLLLSFTILGALVLSLVNL